MSLVDEMRCVEVWCTYAEMEMDMSKSGAVITSERAARSEFLLIYTKNLSMSGRPARRPAGRGHAFERLIFLEP